MLNIQNGIRSLTEFKQNSADILGYIKETHSPAILTVNGRAEAVLLDPQTYQNMVNKISLAESSRKIESSLIEMENDSGISASEVFKKLRKKFV
ncbi:MAG: PHD/YefM family antitoxin component YafN of YafNO toxin-antitoxin module [Rickettsiales bacterium]|jgi:PHD/YefM family antitoxin component YafN of YafNO toxin-antitoxin module